MVMVEVFIIIFCIGTIVGYLVIIGDVATPYVNLAFACDRRLVILFFGALICLPLSALRKISMLRFTSFLGLFFICYLVILICVTSIMGMSSPDFDPDRVVLISVNGKFLTALPVIGELSFSCF